MSARNITVLRQTRTVTLPVKASTTIRAGEIVFRITASKVAIPADVAAARTCVGIALATVDNSGGNDGDKTVTCVQGEFLLKNAGGSNGIVAGDVGGTAYVETAESSMVEGALGNDSTNKSPVGPIINALGYSGETGVVVRIET